MRHPAVDFRRSHRTILLFYSNTRSTISENRGPTGRNNNNNIISGKMESAELQCGQHVAGRFGFHDDGRRPPSTPSGAPVI